MNKSDEPQGCLTAILSLFGIRLSNGNESEAETQTSYPYERKNQLLTKTERLFFHQLREVTKDQYQIFAMVRLADLLKVPKGTEQWKSHFNRIKSKHIDFVLCDPDKLTPVLCIELDDPTHNKPDRQARDEFVNKSFEAASLPLLRVPTSNNYDGLASSIANAVRS